jgi:hypothetical protein
MKQGTRIYYSDEQKSIMWDRWQKGDSFRGIARIFDRGHFYFGHFFIGR